MRLNWVTRTGVEGAGTSHLSTCKRNDLSEIFIFTSFNAIPFESMPALFYSSLALPRPKESAFLRDEN